MPSPDKTPNIEGTVDGKRAKDQDDSISRRSMKESGKAVTKPAAGPATVTTPPVYGGRRR